MVPPPRIRRIRLALAAILGLAGALLWISTRPEPPAPPPEPVHVASRIALADVAPYGANFFLEREADPWVRRKTVEMAADAGIRWAKQQFLWAYIEPEAGVYEWEDYDEIVDLFLEHDIDVIARLDWPPDWVEKPEWVPDSFRTRQNVPPRDMSMYARFVAETVRHFRGRVRCYQIWNEPNLIAEWGFNPAHPVDPREYVSMLEAAAGAARKVDPDVVILSAPLAINVETVDLAGNMSDLEYLRGMYEAGAAEHFDVLSANAFGMEEPPSAGPAPDALNFRRVELQREIMEESGDGDKPVWIAEYGWNAAPETVADAWWGRVPEQVQADWTVEGVQWAERNWPWCGVLNLWYFRQWGKIDPDRAVYYFRMVDTDFTPRRAYASVKEDASGRYIAGPGVWAERSAPVRLPLQPAERELWSWVWSKGADDRSAIQSAEAGASLSFSFRGAGIRVRTLTGPQAGSMHVAMDGHPLSTTDGRSVWPLQAADRAWQWRLLADDLAPGHHELGITVGTAGGTVAIDSFEVLPHEASAGGPSATVWGLALAVVGCLAVVLTDAAHVVSRLPR